MKIPDENKKALPSRRKLRKLNKEFMAALNAPMTVRQSQMRQLKWMAEALQDYADELARKSVRLRDFAGFVIDGNNDDC